MRTLSERKSKSKSKSKSKNNDKNANSNLGQVVMHDTIEGTRLGFARIYNSAESPAREQPVAMVEVVKEFISKKQAAGDI
jgi:hypothetical protein